MWTFWIGNLKKINKKCAFYFITDQNLDLFMYFSTCQHVDVFNIDDIYVGGHGLDKCVGSGVSEWIYKDK